MFVAPAPVSSVAAVGTSMFAAWATEGEADGAIIRSVYASMDGTTGENGDELLAERATLKEGTNIGFLLCVDEADGEPKPHLVALNRLLPGPRSEEEAQDIYAWVAETTACQAPVTVRVNAAWICATSGQTKVNKTAAVDATIHASPSARRIPLNSAAPTERVKTPRMVYLPWCLWPRC